MKGDRWLVVIGALLVSGLLAIANTRHVLSGWSFTKSVEVKKTGQDRGYYYRFKANYTYKGEPLDFDIVVGCNVEITTYKDNDRTVEVGIVPTIFGLKTKDERGVAIQPPQACNGETSENGKVPKTLLPLVVTYQSADKPWFGVAYASEDAYDSPRSELKFRGATISRATYEEWRVWRDTEAKKNFITYALLGINPENMWDSVKWKPGLRVMASNCLSASRVRLPDAVRNVLRPFWPPDKPVYWFPDDRTRQALWRTAYDPENPPLLEGNRFRDYYADFVGKNGLARREPGAEIFFNRQVEGDVYPARTDLSINRLEPGGELPDAMKIKERLDYSAVEIQPELRGFAFCEGSVVKIDNVPKWPNQYRYANRINGEQISEALGKHFSYNIAFQRDEYILFLRRYEFASGFAKL